MIWGDLLANIRGAIFFGVPHRGADLAYWAKFATQIIQNLSLGFVGNSNFVEPLVRNSATFAKISDLFIERGSKIAIRTFYETKRMRNKLVSG